MRSIFHYFCLRRAKKIGVACFHQPCILPLYSILLPSYSDWVYAFGFVDGVFFFRPFLLLPFPLTKAHGGRVFRDFHAEFLCDAAGYVPVYLLVSPH